MVLLFSELDVIFKAVDFLDLHRLYSFTKFWKFRKHSQLIAVLSNVSIYLKPWSISCKLNSLMLNFTIVFQKNEVTGKYCTR